MDDVWQSVQRGYEALTTSVSEVVTTLFEQASEYLHSLPEADVLELVYVACLAVLTVVLLSWFPRYYELKLLILCWITFRRGANTLYRAVRAGVTHVPRLARLLLSPDLQPRAHGALQGEQLLREDGEHLGRHPVELVEARPPSGEREAFEEARHLRGGDPQRAVEHEAVLCHRLG